MNLEQHQEMWHQQTLREEINKMKMLNDIPVYLRSDFTHYMQELADLAAKHNCDDVLSTIIKAVVQEAAEKAYNAGMAGNHDDGGASAMIDSLKSFLQGVSYGVSSDQDNLGAYGKVYQKIARENDPKYKEYLRLKEIYGDD